MADRASDLPPNVDPGVLGQAMLDAACAARIGVSVTLITPNGLRNIYANEVTSEILGLPLDEFLKADPISLVAPEDQGRLRERDAKRRSGESGPASYEVTGVRKDGKRVPLEVTASSVIVGGCPAVLTFIVDVSARRAAEDARHQTEARFRELIDKGPEPILIICNGFIVYANAAFVATLGYATASELYPLPANRLVRTEDIPTIEARIKLMLSEGARLAAYTYHGLRRDGSTVLLEASSVPFEYEGKPSILTMARDVTARRTLEARLVQSDRLAALGTMAAGVAHEINNPLAYLMLNLDWIARKLSEGVEPSNIDGLTEMLREARRGAERVATIVRELRSFSRADDDTRRSVDLEAVVHSAIRIASHEIRHRARIKTAFAPVRRLWANEGRVEQVVLNLLLNAAQAMPEGRASENEICIGVRATADHRAILEVADNGAGIPVEVLPRIFDPFFTTKPTGIGTGLGLSICHGIVTSLGGQITVHSEPNRGTTFRVVLPTVLKAESEPQVPEDPAPPTPRGTRPGRPRARILVVDDEIQIANTMRELLAPDHDVIATTSGREALSIVCAGRTFDVVFCDLMMPAMSGVELYEKFRVAQPGLEHRVVFMTGGAFTTRAAEFLATVDNRRIEKPFSLGLIERIVNEMRAANGAST